MNIQTETELFVPKYELAQVDAGAAPIDITSEKLDKEIILSGKLDIVLKPEIMPNGNIGLSFYVNKMKYGPWDITVHQSLNIGSDLQILWAHEPGNPERINVSLSIIPPVEP